MSLNILAISDTHSYHNQFNTKDFEGIDMVIHAGDGSNSMSPYINYSEFLDFITWYSKLDVKYKVFVAGNHETALEKRLITKQDLTRLGIIYLEHEAFEVEGIKLFGSPYTPNFGTWAFMKSRSKLDPYWQQIPDDTDILITHGPPKGILDLSYSRERELEYCGDKSLYNHVLRVQPKYHIFGHIHNYEDCYNSGQRTVSNLETIFLNVSCVTDREFDKGLTSKGHKFKL